MLLEGHQLGRYRLVRQVGSGGMGTIFLAEDTHMPRQVAVKVVHTEDEMQHSQEAAQRMLRSFRREMRAIVQLDHPHILPVFDFGQETINKATYAYLVMLYRPEGSLSDWLCQPQNAARLTLSDVAQLLTQAAQALQHAHARGIVHQDVKPSNFLVRVDNELLEALPELLLADFGIAQFFSATTTQSQSHNVRGTPMFMAPEQWDGRPVPASDQYALAIMAFRLLAGRFPFQGTMGQIMHHHYMMQPPTPSSLNPQLNTAIDHTILRALAKQPDQRYPNMLAFASAFTQALRTPEDLQQVPLTFSAPGDASLPSLSEQISGASMPFQPAKQETGKTPSLPMPPLNEPSATQDQMLQRVHLTKNAVPSRIGTSALINDLSSDATPTPQNPHAGVNIPAASDDSTFISPPRQMGSTVLIPCAAAISIDDTRPPSLNNSTETQQPTLVPQPVPVPPTIQPGPTGKASLSHNWLQPIISHTQRFSTRQKNLLIGLLALVILASSGILLYKDLSGSNGNSAHTQNSAQASTIIQQGQTPASSVTIVAKHTVTPTASQTPPRTQTSTPVVGSTAASGTTSQPTTTPTSSSSTTRQPTATPTPTAVPKPAATPTPTPGCTISSWSLTLKTESSGSTVFHVTAYCNRTVYIELQAPTYETNIQICFGSSNCTGWNSAPSTAAGTWVEFDSGVSVGAGFTINAECHSSCSSTYTVSGKAKY